jgi:hypothetical protein
MKKLAALTLSLFMSVGTALADSPKDTPKDSPKSTDAQPAKNNTAAKSAPAKTNAEIAVEMEELRQAMQAQQEQLQQLKEELAKRDRQIEEARETAAAANSRAAEANVKATEAEATSAEVKTTTSALNNSVASMAASNTAASSSSAGNAAGSPVATTGAQTPDDKGPLTIRYKGIDITPGGFLAAETVNRQRALSDDINTQFNAVPFGGNSVGKLSELNITARQSRLSMLFGANIGTTKVSGYVETDFLGAGTTSNNRQTNSYVLRYRQFWGRADFANGWAFSAGQMWSLATENKQGIVNRQEWLPMMIDPQYVVGFTWQRAGAVRVSKSFDNKLTLAVAAENPQATVGGRGFSTYTSTTATGVVTTYQNFFGLAPGASGGLQNAFDTTGYSVNKLPDFIVKGALDPGWGHYEVFGIVSEFRNRVYPCAVVGTTAGNFPKPTTPTAISCASLDPTAPFTPSVAGVYNNSSTGGAVGGSLDVPLFSKKLDVGLKGFYGDGEGRFGSAQLQDVTARPDGTYSLIHSGHWLGRLEWHVTPKVDIYAYLGGEYAARAAYTGYHSVGVTHTPAIPGCGAVGQQPCPGGGIQPSYPALTTTSVSTTGIGGYGSPYANNSGCSTEVPPAGTSAPGTGGTCAGDTRYIQEATIGFWQKFYQGEKGRVQWGIQYSYFYRTAWSGSNGITGTTSIGPHAVNNMIWTSFRYYLP